jgi:hypothetical protein
MGSDTPRPKRETLRDEDIDAAERSAGQRDPTNRRTIGYQRPRLTRSGAEPAADCSCIAGAGRGGR